MPLVVENGSGLANAESYVSVTDCAAYAAARGLAFPASPEAVAEAALRRSTAWLEATYRARFSGRRKKGRAQALEWPRIGAVDATGEEVAEAEVPAEVTAAACEAAVRELSAPGSLSPDYIAADRVKQEQVGDISVTYQDTKGGAADVRPVVSVVDGILSSLLGAEGTALFGATVRA